MARLGHLAVMSHSKEALDKRSCAFCARGAPVRMAARAQLRTRALSRYLWERSCRKRSVEGDPQPVKRTTQRGVHAFEHKRQLDLHDAETAINLGSALRTGTEALPLRMEGERAWRRLSALGRLRPAMDARHTLRLRRADPCAQPIAGCPSRDVELANFMAPASKEENIKHPKSRRRESHMLTLPAPSAMCSSFLRPVSFHQTKTRSRPLIASPSDPPPVSLCHAISSPCAQPRRARIHKVSGNSCTRARCGKGRCAGKRRAGRTQGAAGGGGEEQDGEEGGQGEEVENARAEREAGQMERDGWHGSSTLIARPRKEPVDRRVCVCVRVAI